MKHPLHTLFVHIPIGLWVGSLVCDIAFLLTRNTEYSAASYYMMLIGLCGVLLAAPTGIAEFLSIPINTRPRNIAATHMSLNVFVSVLYLFNLFVRRGTEGITPVSVSPGEFIFSLVCVSILALSGYLGGMLVYNYGIGHRKSEFEEQPEPIRKVA